MEYLYSLVVFYGRLGSLQLRRNVASRVIRDYPLTLEAAVYFEVLCRFWLRHRAALVNPVHPPSFTTDIHLPQGLSSQ